MQNKCNICENANVKSIRYKCEINVNVLKRIMSTFISLYSLTLRVVAIDPNLPVPCMEYPCSCWLGLITRLASSPIAPSALSDFRAVGRAVPSPRSPHGRLENSSPPPTPPPCSKWLSGTTLFRNCFKVVCFGILFSRVLGSLQNSIFKGIPSRTRKGTSTPKMS